MFKKILDSELFYQLGAVFDKRKLSIYLISQEFLNINYISVKIHAKLQITLS